MPKTRLISPGSIPNHKLLKNLQLQGKYISNDGGDEGISIDDDGVVTHSTHAVQTGRLYLYDLGGELIYGNGNDLVIGAERDMTLDCGRTLLLDVDVDTGTAGARNLINIDLDKVGSVTTGTDTIKGINFDLSTTGASGGTITSYGIDMDVTGDTGGTSTAIGMRINANGADVNYPLITTGGNIGIGTSAPDRAVEINDSGGNCLRLTYNDSSGSASNYADMTVADDGHLEIAATGSDADISIKPNDGLFLHASSYLRFYDSDSEQAFFRWNNGGNNQFRINYYNNVINYLDFIVGANGETTISTVDSDGAAGHLNIVPNGHIKFDACAAGFTRHEETFSVTDIKATGGTDDTDIDFRVSNKIRLEMTGDIAQMNLIFPAVSGNFVMVCTTNGDHDVTAWKVWESDLTDATTEDVMWAGGSVPAFTNNGIDIVSFYWDATEQQCYGVASLAFATP
tara:strand:+ start:1079 stop:2443 length:1365 start_codon:yes stop_codon:yes gene_type:complete